MDVRMPDGVIVRGVPDDITQEELLRRYKQFAEENRTIGGYAKEALKAVPRGLVSGLETAALGASALLPGDTETGFEKTAREGIKGFAERLKPTAAAGYEEAIPTKLGEAVGSFGSLLIPGGIGSVAARGLGLAAGVGRTAAVAPTAAAMGAGEAREKAVVAGATPEQITKATQFGIIPGIAELAPVERVFRAMPQEIKGGIFDYVKRALVTGGFEGAQEAASAVAQNLIAREVYKPSQELIEGVGEDAAYGAGAGAIVQFLLDAVAGRRAGAGAGAQPAPVDRQAEILTQRAARQEERALPARAPVFYGAPEGEVMTSPDAFEARDIVMQRLFEQENLQKQQPELFRTQVPTAKPQPEMPEERPEFALTSEQQLELPLEARPQPEGPEVSKVTEQTLVGIGIKPGVARTAKFSKEMQKLDLTKAEDIDKFESLLEDYGNKSSAKRPYSATAAKKLISNARFRLSQQQTLDFGEPSSGDQSSAAGKGMVAPVSQPAAGGPATAEVGAADVVGGEGTTAGAAAGEGARPTALTATDFAFKEPFGEAQLSPVSVVKEAESQVGAPDVDEVASAERIAAETKNPKTRLNALAYLSFFKNSPDVGPTARKAASDALDRLNVPEEEARAAWENLAVSQLRGEADQQIEQEAAAEAAKENKAQQAARRRELRGKLSQRGLVEFLKRELATPLSEDEAKARMVAYEKQAEEVKAKKQKERAALAAASKRLTVPAPADVPFKTPKDAEAVLNTYLDDVEKGDPKIREDKRRGLKKQLPVKEFVDKADREEISRLMEAGKYDAAHTAIVTAVHRAATAARANMFLTEFIKTSAAAERNAYYKLSHTPVGAALPDAAVKKLQAGDLKGALRVVMTTGSTPQIRMIARKILNAIGGTKISVQKQIAGDAGIYDPATDTIYIDPQALHEHTLLHESAHAALAHILSDANHPLTKKLQALYESVGKDIAGTYGAENLQEFAAEALGNQEFQDLLRGQPKGWWGRFVDAIRGFFGLSKAKQIMRTLDQLLEAAPSIAREGAQVRPLKLKARPSTGNAVLDAYVQRRDKIEDDIQTKNKPSSWMDKFRNLVVEKGASLERKLLDAGATKPVMAYGMSLRSMDLAVNSMISGPIALDPKTNDVWFTIDRRKPSFKDIYAEVDKIEKAVGDKKVAQQLFGLGSTYLRLQSPDIDPAIRKLMNMSPEDNLAAQEALRLYGKEIRAAVAKWQEFKNALLITGVKTGRFTKEDVAEWMKAPDYVPWHRILDDAKNGYDTKKSTKQYFNRLVDNGKIAELIGGDINKRPIGDILSNMENLSAWLVNTTVRNHTANQLVDALVTTVKDARPLPGGPQSGDPARTIKTYRDGNEKFWELGDPLDKDAFDATSTITLPMLKIFGANLGLPQIANWMRKGTTLMPGFIVSQLFQDAFRVTLLSGGARPFMTGAKTFSNFNTALWPSREQNLAYAALYEAGIAARPDFMVGDEMSRMQAALDHSQTGLRKGWKKTAEFFDNLARASDAAQRMALFDETFRETGDKMTALYKASEIINFQRQGKSAVVNLLRQLVPFMNAYIQGLDVAYRSFTRQGISAKDRTTAMQHFYATGVKLAALSMLYAMLVSDDDEYKTTADHEKLNSFIIPGSRDMVKEATGVDINGNVKIPTPQDPLGFVFKSIPEQVYNYTSRMGTDSEVDNTKFLRIMRDGVINALSSPNLVPQAAKPTVELLANYSFFSGNPIVGKSLQGLMKNEQFTGATSEFAKVLSPFTPLSPVQLDYFIRGTFGTAGATALYLTSQMMNVGSPVPLPESKLNEIPMIRTFLTGNAAAGLKEDYYELRDQSTKLANTISRLAPVDPQKAREYLAEHPELYALAKSGVFSRVDDVLSQLRTMRRVIEGGAKTPQEKREALNQLDAMELRLFQGLRIEALRKIGKL